MARLARVTVAGMAYHVTHRANRGCGVFAAGDDRDATIALLARYARAHVPGCPDPLLASWNPLAGDVDDCSAWLRAVPDDPLVNTIRRNTMTGRPCGAGDFLTQPEQHPGHILRPMRTGRKPRADTATNASPDFFGTAE